MLARSYQLDVKKLEILLIQRGWAADEIALRGVFSQRRVEQIMQGARVYRSNLKRIADLFGVQPQDLILAAPQVATAAPATASHRRVIPSTARNDGGIQRPFRAASAIRCLDQGG